MWIELSKVVVYFFFCSNVVSAYYAKQDYSKQSDRDSSNKYYSSVSGSRFNNDNYKLRQSRFPKIDKVKTRIEQMNSELSSSSYVKIRHKGWSNYRPLIRTTTTPTTTTTEDEGLFESYGDSDEDLDYLEDDDDEMDYDDDPSDTDDSFFDSVEDIQAEEPTERAVIPYKPSNFAEYKWRNYGTSDTVAASRKQHMSGQVSNAQTEINKVVQHYVRVKEQVLCRKPLPKVISVQKEHPDETKTYTPHCTVLHRCAEDTGCCKHDSKCQWKSRVLVELYFYSKLLGSPETKVEKLSFYNHTECECKEKSNYTLSDGMENGSGPSFKSADSFNPPQNSRRCQCPKHFQSVLSVSRCTCNCDEGHADCIQLKKGKEHLSITDRICIAKNECTTPVCEYGVYSSKEGKCPSKKQKIDEYRKIKIIS